MHRQPPGPGQESVWDYPRPPRLEPVAKRIRVVFDGETIADSRECFRVLETSHPPVYYIPPSGVRLDRLQPTTRQSLCEFKGLSRYWSIHGSSGRESPAAVWSYSKPVDAFGAILGYFAFYAGRVDACYVDDVLVIPQHGGFYGGWITPEIVGPFKGEAGTLNW